MFIHGVRVSVCVCMNPAYFYNISHLTDKLNTSFYTLPHLSHVILAFFGIFRPAVDVATVVVVIVVVKQKCADTEAPSAHMCVLNGNLTWQNLSTESRVLCMCMRVIFIIRIRKWHKKESTSAFDMLITSPNTAQCKTRT